MVQYFLSPPGISKLIGYLFNFQINAYLIGAVSRNSAKLGNYKMPVKLREI